MEIFYKNNNIKVSDVLYLFLAIVFSICFVLIIVSFLLIPKNNVSSSNINGNKLIYVYKLPDFFLKSWEECSSSMFASEIALYNYFIANSERPFITEDITKADLFYIPTFSTCDLLHVNSVLKEASNKNKHKSPHYSQISLLHKTFTYLSNHNLYRYYFTRNSHYDHIITLSHDFGPCLWHKDYRPKLKSNTSKDLLEEHTNANNLNKNFKYVLHSVRETMDKMIVLTPFNNITSQCYSSNKNMIITIPPYYKISDKSFLTSDISRTNSYKAFFKGTINWKWFDTIDESYSHGVRQKLYNIYQQYPSFLILDSENDNDVLYVTNNKEEDLYAKYTNIYNYYLSTSDFCLCPIGYAPWSPRYVAAILHNCLPVFVGTGANNNTCTWPFSKLSHIINYNDFSISIDDIGSIATVLKNKSQLEIIEMRKKLKNNFSYFIYRYQNTDYINDFFLSAEDMIIYEIFHRINNNNNLLY